MIDCQSSRRTKRWQRNRKEAGKDKRRGRENVLTIGRTIVSMPMFGTSPNFQSILLIPSLSLSRVRIDSLCSIVLRNRQSNDEEKMRYTHLYTYVSMANCRFHRIRDQGGSRTTSTILPYWSNQFFRRDHNNSLRNSVIVFLSFLGGDLLR